MNKRSFTIKIDDSDYQTPLSETWLEDSLRLGFYEKGLGNISILSVEKQIVEQTVERPQDKTFQLLEKAESVLSDSEHCYHWSVAKELRNHLDELRGKNKENEDKMLADSMRETNEMISFRED